MKIIKLNEDFKLGKGVYNKVVSILSNILKNKKQSSWSQAVFILCSIYNYVNKANISPNDYILHHINGKKDDSITNMCLLNININHNTFHSDAKKRVAMEFANYKHIDGNIINVDIFDNLTPDDLAFLEDAYVQILTKQAERANKKNKEDIIFIDQIIGKDINIDSN